MNLDLLNRIYQWKSNPTTTFIASLVKSLAIIFLFQSQIIYACNTGGCASGGGHDIEAGFKEAQVRILKELSDLPTSAKTDLLFNPTQILTFIQIPGNTKPKCATPEELIYLKNNSKMAWVYGDTSHVQEITLDCSISFDVWNGHFISNTPADKTFFIHEALRTTDNKMDDNYSLSSSIADALNNYDKLVRNTVGKAIAYSNSELNKNNCKLIPGRDHTGHINPEFITKIKLTLNDEVLMNEPLNECNNPEECGALIGDILNLILNGKDTKYEKIRQSIYKFYETGVCSLNEP